jgi:hypothetical protein
MEVTDIHEDNLALFVDDGMSIRIERNFAIPPLPPRFIHLSGNTAMSFIFSTHILDGAEPPASNTRGSFGSFSLQRRKSLVGGSLIELSSGQCSSKVGHTNSLTTTATCATSGT